ncbi:hypothetical protein RFI_39526, partial [Reticulomyxa filosa]
GIPLINEIKKRIKDVDDEVLNKIIKVLSGNPKFSWKNGKENGITIRKWKSCIWCKKEWENPIQHVLYDCEVHLSVRNKIREEQKKDQEKIILNGIFSINGLAKKCNDITWNSVKHQIPDIKIFSFLIFEYKAANINANFSPNFFRFYLIKNFSNSNSNFYLDPEFFFYNKSILKKVLSRIRVQIVMSKRDLKNTMLKYMKFQVRYCSSIPKKKKMSILEQLEYLKCQKNITTNTKENFHLIILL